MEQPSHTSNRSINYLRERFQGRLISRRGDILWPPRSPDLAVPDFFLWGYIKQEIWKVPRNQQPASWRQLRAAITRECRNIPRNVIQNAFHAVIQKCQKCINARGHVFADE